MQQGQLQTPPSALLASGEPAPAAAKRNRFDPSAWANQRKEKIQKGEELRQQNRSRMIATGQLLHSNSSSMSARTPSPQGPLVPGTIANLSAGGGSASSSSFGAESGGGSMASAIRREASPLFVDAQSEFVQGSAGNSYTGRENAVGSPSDLDVAPVFDRKYLNRNSYDHQNYRYAGCETEYNPDASSSTTAEAVNATANEQVNLPPPRKFNRVDNFEEAPAQRSQTSVLQHQSPDPCSYHHLHQNRAPAVSSFSSTIEGGSPTAAEVFTTGESAGGGGSKRSYTLDSPLEDAIARPTSSRAPASSYSSSENPYVQAFVSREASSSTSSSSNLHAASNPAVSSSSASQHEADDEAQQQWLGMLRGGDNSSTSDDPLVFGNTAGPRASCDLG
eukprot:CAMPEP_0178985968 /NCGR_PEP_ID=MMETSP0795-20121207/2443_1 /TAXON_ID=88552 /ORGANISM="Amoebophrya sp., Strain Ameob2" /LENGTH=390 /DNA_ID=CAMNT_0020676977 /DNA_START=110 /DNA_END=1279 /DNA_ORIENTATION=-